MIDNLKKTVRTFEVNGELLFMGKDTGLTLGFTDYHFAIRQYCKGPVKLKIPDRNGRLQVSILLQLPDVYRLIINSDIPSAVVFEQWLFSEALPSFTEQNPQSLSQFAIRNEYS